MLDIASQNLLSPMVLFFALGLLAALARSDLSIPESVAKALAIYLMLAIGYTGGAKIAVTGFTWQMAATIGVGILLSFAIPGIAFALLRATSRLNGVDAAAVAAHYGSISIVTFVAASETVRLAGLTVEGYLIAVAAAMEAPAILSALMLARRHQPTSNTPAGSHFLREIALNSSIVMLLGSFAIGWISGPRGMEMIQPFIVDPFRGILCLFLLDMGLVAGRSMREGSRHLSAAVVAFGLYMPLVSAAIAAGCAWLLGLSYGGAALFMTLAASASYIAVPAAMRLALPAASPAIYLTLSLGVTFPFNLAFGIPLYLAAARFITGA
jgi:uncharacterized protein